MRVYVTGSNGTLGRAFCEQNNAKSQYEIVRIDRETFYDPKKLAIDKNVESVLVHLAWPVSSSDYATSELNFTFAKKSKEFIAYFKENATVSQIICAGTYLEYGNASFVDDDCELNPQNAYAASKVELRDWVKTISSSNANWIAITNLVSGFDPSWKFVGSMLRAKNKFKLHTPGIEFDYIHSSDVASAFWTVIKNNIQTFSILSATGRSLTNTILAKALLPATCEIEYGVFSDRKITTFPQVLFENGWQANNKELENLVSIIRMEYNSFN